jgi:hypothetical protein
MVRKATGTKKQAVAPVSKEPSGQTSTATAPATPTAMAPAEPTAPPLSPSTAAALARVTGPARGLHDIIENLAPDLAAEFIGIHGEYSTQFV